MVNEASLTPSELREPSNEDQLVVSSIYPRQITLPVQSFGRSLKSWVEPVRIYLWTDLPKCMKFIAQNGCIENRSLIWIRRTLDRISSTATPKQLEHILNGYADLHKLVLYFIRFTDNVPVSENAIRTFGGTSSNIEQQKRHRNIAFIMYNSEKSLFAPLYAPHNDGHLQTCFATDDERITDHIAHLFRGLNHEISQHSAPEIDHTSDNHDATKNSEETQKTDNLDAPVPSESTVQNEAVLTTLNIREDDIQHASQIIVQSDCHSNQREIITDSTESTTNDLNSSSGTDLIEKKVRQQLDHMTELLDQARRLGQEVGDVSSMETDDRQPVTNAALKERELISKNGIMNTTQSKTGHTKRHVHSSNNNRSHTPVCLSKGTTEPTTIAIPNVQTISKSVQLYDAPNVTKQPKRHRRVRMLNDFAKKDCPLVQAGEGKTQRTYPEIEVPGDGDEELHARVRVVTENRHPNPFKTVVPEHAPVNLTLMEDNNERMCLQCDPDSFDPKTECVFLKITDDERQKRRKIIKVHLFNWKQYGPTIKEVIEHENLRLYRLEFCLCIRLGPGQYQLVSEPSYTSVIEEVDGDVTIDPNKIKPKQLCELGGEQILVPLSVQCRKQGFRIECNGKDEKFTMERKKLLFTSPPKAEGTDELHLIIKRTEYVRNSSIREENQLYDDYLPYVAHGQCVHTCSQPVFAVATDQIS